jgi:hypothetical protein
MTLERCSLWRMIERYFILFVNLSVGVYNIGPC